jgi:endonuclease I
MGLNLKECFPYLQHKRQTLAAITQETSVSRRGAKNANRQRRLSLRSALPAHSSKICAPSAHRRKERQPLQHTGYVLVFWDVLGVVGQQPFAVLLLDARWLRTIDRQTSRGSNHARVVRGIQQICKDEEKTQCSRAVWPLESAQPAAVKNGNPAHRVEGRFAFSNPVLHHC